MLSPLLVRYQTSCTSCLLQRHSTINDDFSGTVLIVPDPENEVVTTFLWKSHSKSWYKDFCLALLLKLYLTASSKNDKFSTFARNCN